MHLLLLFKLDVMQSLFYVIVVKTHAINNFTFLTSWGKRNIQMLHLEFRVWNLLSLSDLLLYEPPSPLTLLALFIFSPQTALLSPLKDFFQ